MQISTPDNGHVEAAFGDWLATVPGRALLAQEQRVFAELSSDFFGYHLLQLGTLDGDYSYLSECTVRHKTVLAMGVEANTQSVGAVRADCLRLPIASDSVDAVLLPHTLDFASSPHQVLREVERVLIPDGRLLISGFNPFSAWGVWRLLLKRRGSVPWTGNFVPYTHLQDWLSLLGFDIEVTRVRMFRPPLQGAGVLERLQFLERVGERFWPVLAGVYVIRAVKRTARLTPIEPNWESRPIVAGVIEPSARAANG